MKISNLFSERKDQLEKQELIDNKLKELNCMCSDLVSEYLLLQRNITRNQQYKIINTNLLYIYDEMGNQLKINQIITNRFLNTNVNCKELKNIILDNKFISENINSNEINK